MTRVHPYLDVLRALTQAEVRFVVVGGVAVTLHGHMRATVDLDIVLDLVTENITRALAALTDLGLIPRLPVAVTDFADSEIRRHWVQERNLMVFSLYDPTNPLLEVDLFAAPPIAHAELSKDASSVSLNDIDVLIASRAHLIEMKQLAGRPQDLADIAALEALGG